MVDEVDGVLSAGVLYPKVIDDKTKCDRLGSVFEQAWCESGGDVSSFCEVFNQLLVCKSASLWQSIHPFPYFDEDFIVAH